MNDDKLRIMITEYFDGELDKDKETILFSLLSGDEANRNFFKKLNKIKSITEASTEEFPFELEERILKSVGSVTASKSEFFSNSKIFSAISYATALILLFLSGYLFFKVSSYQEEIDNLSKQMTFQSRTIQLLYNSLPGIEVQASLENMIIVKPKI